MLKIEAIIKKYTGNAGNGEATDTDRSMTVGEASEFKTIPGQS